MRQRRAQTQTQPPCPWRIQSTPVQARDGPERLLRVYQLLLQSQPAPPVERDDRWSSLARGGATEAEESADASRDLRSRLDPASGT